jgi:very-short-patch-repair endonuclease
MRGKGAIDLRIAGLAGAQHGVVSRAQLRLLGLSDDAIDRRVARGRLHILHRGVYAVGHRTLTTEGRWMAAVMAGGRDAVLSHASAAAAWELRPAGGAAIHVTVPDNAGRKRRTGIRVHRSTALEPAETTTVRAIPVTTPIRTIIDVAATLRGRPLEHVLDLAEQRRLVDFAELRQHLADHPGRPGSPSLQAVLSLYTAGSTVTRSEMEERFLALCDSHGLQRPDVNTRIEGVEVDFAWRDARVVVEVDGYAYHRAPSAFERDRERDVMLAVAGWQVLRFTWTQLTEQQAWVARAISKCLAL